MNKLVMQLKCWYKFSSGNWYSQLFYQQMTLSSLLYYLVVYIRTCFFTHTVHFPLRLYESCCCTTNSLRNFLPSRHVLRIRSVARLMWWDGSAMRCAALRMSLVFFKTNESNSIEYNRCRDSNNPNVHFWLKSLTGRTKSLTDGQSDRQYDLWTVKIAAVNA